MKSSSLLASFKYAWEGIAHAFGTQRNFRVHVAIAAAVGVAGLLLRIGPTEWAVVFLTVGVVMGAELINTALEAVVDHVAPEFHALAKIAKDCAAGAVFITALAAVGVGAFIFVPRVLAIVR